MMRRFSSITFTAMVRCEVARGIDRLAAMFSAMRPAAPRRGWNECGRGGAGAAGGAAPRGPAEGVERMRQGRGRRGGCGRCAWCTIGFLEEVLPAFVYRRTVAQVLFIQFGLKRSEEHTS